MNQPTDHQQHQHEPQPTNQQERPEQSCGEPQPTRGRRFLKFVRRIGPAGPLALLWGTMPAIAGIVLIANIGGLSEWLQSLGPTGPLLYVGVFAVSAGFGFLPTYAQAILGGWVFGLAIGLPAALAGFTGAALIGYGITRLLASHRVEDLIAEHPRAQAVRNALIGQGFLPTFGIVTLVRIPPNSPFALTNLALASSGAAVFPFAIGTLIGMAPRTAVAVGFASAAAATGSRDLQEFAREGLGPWVLVGGVVTMLGVLAIIGHVANRALARVVDNHCKSNASTTTPAQESAQSSDERAAAEHPA